VGNYEIRTTALVVWIDQNRGSQFRKHRFVGYIWSISEPRGEAIRCGLIDHLSVHEPGRYCCDPSVVGLSLCLSACIVQIDYVDTKAFGSAL
jgi:hypothetical protein